MRSIDKIVSNHWGLPVEQALRVEALSHNMSLVDVQTETSLHKILSDIIRDEENINRIIKMPPFNVVKDKRFQIFVTYWFYRPMWDIEKEGLEGDESTLFMEKGYWNWYSIEEEAVNKYEEKLNVLIEDPCYYADLGCMDVKFARIVLIDTAYNRILRERYFKI